MSLLIDLPPELQQRLEDAAARKGQDAATFTRAVLEEKLAALDLEPSEEPRGGSPLGREAWRDLPPHALPPRLREALERGEVVWGGGRLQPIEPTIPRAPGPSGKTLSELLLEDRR